jgi:hypothetical protein
MEASAPAFDALDASMVVPDNIEQEEIVGLIHINIYDSYLSNCSQVVRRATKTKEITTVLSARLHLGFDNSKFFMLVVVVTLLDKNYLRTLHLSEEVQAVETNLVQKLMKRYKISDEQDVRNAVRW